MGRTLNMKTFAISAVAFLCLSQVSGEKRDLLHSLFSEKSKELNSAKLAAPEVFLTANPTTPPKYNCDANEVVINGTTLMKNTLDIISETFSVIYTTAYPSSGSQDCTFTGDFGKFRCYLWEFTKVKDSIKDVTQKVTTYQSNAQGLIEGISAYINLCLRKK